MNEYYGLVVDVEPHWGLSINYFFATKSSLSLPVIPPTTIIGAISYPIAKLMGWPENVDGNTSCTDRIRPMFKGVYYSIINGALIPYSEITKILFYKPDKKEKINSDAVAVQRLYAKPKTIIRLYYVVNGEQASKILGNKWKETLLEAAWSIVRIGAKESLVSVKNARVAKVRLSNISEIKTSSTIPSYNVVGVKGEYISCDVVDWRNSKISRYYGAPMIRIIQPAGRYSTPSKVVVTLRNNQAYIVEYDNVIEQLVPW